MGSSSSQHTDATTRGEALQHGAEKATGRDPNHDGNVGSNSDTTSKSTSHTTSTGTRGRGLEHGLEKATHKDLNKDGSVGDGTGYSTGTTGSGPEFKRDFDGKHTGSTTGASSSDLGRDDVAGSRAPISGTTTGTSGTAHDSALSHDNQHEQHHTGFVEKVKEKVGLGNNTTGTTTSGHHDANAASDLPAGYNSSSTTADRPIGSSSTSRGNNVGFNKERAAGVGNDTTA